MLVVFLPIFVADIKIFSCYNFGFPLRSALTDFTSNYEELLEILGRRNYGFMINEFISYRRKISLFTRAPRHFIKKLLWTIFISLFIIEKQNLSILFFPLIQGCVQLYTLQVK